MVWSTCLTAMKAREWPALAIHQPAYSPSYTIVDSKPLITLAFRFPIVRDRAVELLFYCRGVTKVLLSWLRDMDVVAPRPIKNQKQEQTTPQDALYTPHSKLSIYELLNCLITSDPGMIGNSSRLPCSIANKKKPKSFRQPSALSTCPFDQPTYLCTSCSVEDKASV